MGCQWRDTATKWSSVSPVDNVKGKLFIACSMTCCIPDVYTNTLILQERCTGPLQKTEACNGTLRLNNVVFIGDEPLTFQISSAGKG